MTDPCYASPYLWWSHRPSSMIQGVEAGDYRMKDLDKYLRGIFEPRDFKYSNNPPPRLRLCVNFTRLWEDIAYWIYRDAVWMAYVKGENYGIIRSLVIT